jgi:Aspartyl protease
VSRCRNLILALCGLAAPGMASAGDCVLTPVAALPLLASVRNVPLVPAHIAGQSTWLIIDTGGIRSLIFQQSADALKLARSDLHNNLDTVPSLGASASRVVRRGRNSIGGTPSTAPPPIDTAKIAMLNQLQVEAISVYGTGGQPIREETEGQPVRLGKLDFPDVSFLVIPNGAATDTGVAGMFGMDFLRGYDIELNLAQHWINLFSQDHCDGKGVYWGEAYLKAPIEITEAGQVMVEARLDGQQVRAMIDTGASHSSIRQGDASWLFGIDAHSPGVTAVDSTTSADGSVLATYRAPFKTLELAGITFANPDIHVLPNARGIDQLGRAGISRRADAPVLTLGVNELSRLRIYLALKERMLYVTPAVPDQPT